MFGHTRQVTPESLLARALSGDERIDESEEITARILAGARDVFGRDGIQRSTMEDVAKAAGFSRITVYRRFATKDALVEAVVRWEFRQYFVQFLEDIKAAKSVDERVVIGFASSLRTMRGNSLIGGLLAAEPGSLVPSVVGERSRTFATVCEFLAGQLRTEQKAGNIAAEVDVALVAEMMVRVSTSFLVTPSENIDLDDDAQVRAVAEQFLIPMLHAGGWPRSRR